MSSTRRPVLLVAVTLAVLVAACSPAPDDAEERPGGMSAPRSATAPPEPQGSTAPGTQPGRAGTPAPRPTPRPAVRDLAPLRPPAPAPGPAQLAGQLTAAESVIRDRSSTPHQLARAGLAQQAAYRRLARRPGWEQTVLSALPRSLRRPARMHVLARREFRAMHTHLASTLPAWRIVAPEPAGRLRSLYAAAGHRFGIPWEVLAAINLVETGTGRIRGRSSAGAQGPMQFMPATWAAYGAGGDINNPRDAIMAAARYLAANNGRRDLASALRRYNDSSHYVRGVRLYARIIAESPRAFSGIYHWGIWYLTDRGDIFLPVGYSERRPVPVRKYLSR